jgi:hypothetical protein
MLGKEFTAYRRHMPANPAHYAFSIHSFEMLERLLQDKKIQPHTVKVMGGLEHVPEGFAYMKEGKNSAEKLIYHPLETNYKPGAVFTTPQSSFSTYLPLF